MIHLVRFAFLILLCRCAKKGAAGYRTLRKTLKYHWFNNDICSRQETLEFIWCQEREALAAPQFSYYYYYHYCMYYPKMRNDVHPYLLHFGA